MERQNNRIMYIQYSGRASAEISSVLKIDTLQTCWYDLLVNFVFIIILCCGKPSSFLGNNVMLIHHHANCLVQLPIKAYITKLNLYSTLLLRPSTIAASPDKISGQIGRVLSHCMNHSATINYL